MRRQGPVVVALLPYDAVIRVLSGAAAGREVALHKVVTTIGKPGVAVASITKRIQGFVLAHVGRIPDTPLLNGGDWLQPCPAQKRRQAGTRGHRNAVRAKRLM